MSLSPGTRLGQYEITDAIGAGGMGEVYRATDTKLGREVAIKALPSALASDTDRLARFDREAKLLAALNHPNIAVIYGLEEHDGMQCIAMEFIEGETLEERLKPGPLAVEDALTFALQIAQALEAAHEKGVVHRDLKPANVMITAKGQVKVLDFGLAKAFSEEANEAGLGQSPALSLAMTQQGIILGTAGYMSPEQASGQATDQRADVWAFGVVLFEMLSGLPLFTGESVPHILAAVLQSEPNWGRLPKATDLRIKRLLDRCLRKKPQSRYHAIADVRIDVEEILDDPQGFQAGRGIAQTHSSSGVLPWAAVSLVVGAAVMAVLTWAIWPSPVPQAVDRFDYDLSGAQSFNVVNRRLIDVSPDGRSFVFNGVDGLYLRAMDELEARLIVATSSALSPRFSPDSQSLVYYDAESDELRRIGIGGSAPVVITEFPQRSLIFGLSWSTDGTILFSREDGISRVSATGGTPELLIARDTNAVFHEPRLLPDGDSVMFTVDDTPGSNMPGTSLDDARVVIQSLATGNRSVLVERGSDARLLTTGHLVYAIGDTLFAQILDSNSLTVSGGAVPLVQDVMPAVGPSGNFGAEANFSVSENGTLVYVSGSTAARSRRLVWVDRESREETIDIPPRNYFYPRISPDGTSVALDVRDQERDVWILDHARETLTRLTFDAETEEFPVWSPDGQRIAFASSRLGRQSMSDILWKAADGTGTTERLVEGDAQIFPTSFLPDGTGLLAWGDSDSTPGMDNDDISILWLEAEQNLVPLLDTAFAEKNPDLSPDGRWLAYSSDETGKEEIYVRPFPDVDAGRWQVSTDGGTQALWAHNGRELFYRNGNAVISVGVQTEPSFSVGSPAVVFEGAYVLGPGGRSYDVSNDDERFLMIQSIADESEAPQIVIVRNWFEELKRLVPTGR